MIRVASVVGTRPEVIKMAPVARALEAPRFDHRLIATGQHESLFDQAVSAFGIRIDERLQVGASGGDHLAQADRIRAAVAASLARDRPDLLLVQGDTTSAYAAALAAADAGVPVGHVEAGLRSFNLAEPFPEEGNRVAIDALATLLFAPTGQSAANLAAEPAVTGAVHVTGNTGIGAVLWMRDRISASPVTGGRLVLVTCHRRENHGEPFAAITHAVRALARRGDVEIAFPVHPNPAVRDAAARELGNEGNVQLLPPLDYRAMVELLARTHLLLTDSGGLQEEAPALGLPTLVLRNVTERPEALATGNLRLVGTDREVILREATRLLDDAHAHAAMSVPAFPYGDGHAAERIAAIIAAHFGQAA